MSRPASIAERLLLLEKQIDSLLEKQAPSANMDASQAGATLDGPYLGEAISQRIHSALWEAGFQTVQDIQQATDTELLAVNGVGQATLADIRQACA